MSTPSRPDFILTNSHDYALITVTMSRHGTRLDVCGELDMLTAPMMVSAALACPGNDDVTLDLSQVVFIDAAGLGGLVLATSSYRAVEITALIRGYAFTTDRPFDEVTKALVNGALDRGVILVG
jgi:anti-anti-sigma factor